MRRVMLSKLVVAGECVFLQWRIPPLKMLPQQRESSIPQIVNEWIICSSCVTV